MKVLVTGATGFIGSNLVKALLEQGYDISVVSRRSSSFDPRIKIHQVDLLDANFDDLNLADFDVIFNCAGELKENSKMTGLHIDVPLKMLSFLRGSKCRWVQLSSVGVYGTQMKGEVAENTLFNPVGDYEVTKAAAEQKIVSYCQAYNIDYSILRPSNVIGVDMPNHSMRNLVRAIAQGRFFYMAPPSKVQMNFVHVDNVVGALLLCGFCPQAKGQAFNISDQMTQDKIVGRICRAVDRPIPIIYIPAILVKICVYLFSWLPKTPFSIAAINALTTQAVYSTKKIEQQLNFKKSKPLDEAVDEFIKRYK